MIQPSKSDDSDDEHDTNKKTIEFFRISYIKKFPETVWIEKTW